MDKYHDLFIATVVKVHWDRQLFLVRCTNAAVVVDQLAARQGVTGIQRTVVGIPVTIDQIYNVNQVASPLDHRCPGYVLAGLGIQVVLRTPRSPSATDLVIDPLVATSSMLVEGYQG